MLHPTYPLLAFALIALASFSLALPTQQAAIFEPLFLNAAPVVGPSRSIERLRLRRRSPTPTPVVVEVSPIANSKVKRQAPVLAVAAIKSKRQAAVLSPPKIKVIEVAVAAPKRKNGARAIISSTTSLPIVARSIAPVVVNSKTTRSTVPLVDTLRNPVGVSRHAIANALRESQRLLANVVPSAAPIVSRQVRAGLEAVRKAKRSVAMTANPKGAKRSTLVVVVVENPKLAKRASRGIFQESPVIKAVAAGIVPNPKSPKFAAYVEDDASSSSSSTATATSTSSSTSSSTTSSSTSSRAPTSTRTATTTSAPSSTASPSSTATTVSSTSAAAVATGTSWPTSGGLLAGGYYPDWTANILPPWAVNYKMFDIINFGSTTSLSFSFSSLTNNSQLAAFALPTEDHDLKFTQWNSEETLREVVRYAHGNNTKVLISIGGWTGSGIFSNSVENAENRETFVANILKMVNKFDLDGVDLDWCVPFSFRACEPR